MIGNIVQFTVLHVVVSIIGIVAGLVVAGALISGRRLDGWTATFLATTFLTNLSGFGFPFRTLLPSRIVAGLSLLLLPLVAFALYGQQLAGRWRSVFVIGSVVALYFNVFVLVTQLFAKVPAMIAAAPTQKEAPFVLTHLLMLATFVLIGRAAQRGYRS